MKLRRVLLWVLGLSGTVLTASAAVVIYDVGTSDALYLQTCMKDYSKPFPWVCEKFFYRYHPTPEEVKELNSAAGASFAFEAKNEGDARRQLKRYLDAGVDINAIDQRTVAQTQSKLTALHGAVLRPGLMEVRLLLEFGASREIRDAKGRTPLELAREIQAKNPNPQREEVIRLLEAGKP